MMLCSNPYVKGMHAYGCGQCMPCRINKRREWCHRIVLEAMLREDNSFITLTYSDQNCPLTSDGLPNLNRKDLQDWLKRFRKAILPLRVRFFGVGEYGDETERPHYHLALFGFPTCTYGGSRYKYYKNCCKQCDLIRDTWGLGNVYLGELTIDSAQYVSGYTTKKLTRSDDIRLRGRCPEFPAMSLKPGIGHDMMYDVASSLLEFNLEVSQIDVPSHLRHGAKLLPLGRYLRRKLRVMVGRDEKAPDIVQAVQVEELRPLYPVEEAAPALREARFKQAIIDAGEGRRRQMEGKQKLFNRRKSL